MKIVTVDVEQLIRPRHKARATWYLTREMDLSAFFHGLTSVAGGRERRPWEPQLRVSPRDPEARIMKDGVERKIDLPGSPGNAGQRVANAVKSSGIGPGFEPCAFVRLPRTNCLQCPAGNVLAHVRQSQKRHPRYAQYQAQAADCAYAKQSFPGRGKNANRPSGDRL